MSRIVRVQAREILDSRGRPTVLARCQTESSCGEASVPSGASTGRDEAVELRDGDIRRYRGLGCRKAVANINSELNSALTGVAFSNQAELDRRLLELDGTRDKSRLGANAILAVSLAWARAEANRREVPLWAYFSTLVDCSPASLPRLTINLFSGGKHAGQQVPVQDVLIVPLSTNTVDETLVVAYDIFQAAVELSSEHYSMRLLRADEGGLAPPFRSVEEMLDTAMEAFTAGGYRPGTDVALAMDVAATHFYRSGRYVFGDLELSSHGMIERVKQWTKDYPIISIEDGLGEEDWENWPLLVKELGSGTLTVGDDFLCSNPSRIQKAIETKAANALLLKVNQVGTLSEAAEALAKARSAGWTIVLSVRSGETEDNWAADLAVGWCADQFKNGSITQSERLSKLNRLLEIEQCAGFKVLPFDPSLTGTHSKQATVRRP